METASHRDIDVVDREPTDPPPECTVPDGSAFTWAQTTLLFVVVTAGRFAFSGDRRVFHLFPDEPANLAMARWLSGNGYWNMFESSTYRPGYPTLLAPVFWFSDDQATIIRAGLLLGALIGGLSAVVLARLTFRLTTLSARGALIAAAIVALTPSSLSASAHIWAEPLVTLTFLATLAALLNFYDNPRLTTGAAAIACSVAGYATHGRLLPLVAVTASAAAGWFALQRQWKCAALLSALTIALVGAAEWYANWVYDALWTDPSEINTVGGVLGQLDDPIEILISSTGQLWYLLVTTAGVFGIGIVSLVVGSLGRGDRLPRTRDARIVLAATLPLIGLSIVFMANRERADQLVYGRYNDAVVWPVLVVGFAWIIDRSRTHMRNLDRTSKFVLIGVAAAMVETALIVELVNRDRRFPDLGVVEMVPGLLPAVGTSRELSTWLVTGAALTALAIIAPIVRAGLCRRPVLIVAAFATLALSALQAHRGLGTDLNAGEDSISVKAISGTILPHGADVVLGYVPTQLDPGASLYEQGFYSQLYQWYLPAHRFWITASGDYPEDGFVIAPDRDPLLLQRGATILWHDPAVGMALWHT